MTDRDPLAARWRAAAQTLREYGADHQAQVLEQCAAELEQALTERELETLDLDQAAQESGYSYSALQKLVASGKLPNLGERHRPRIRRGDLPRKPGGASKAPGAGDLAARVLAAQGGAPLAGARKVSHNS